MDFVHRFAPPGGSSPPFTLLLLHGTGGDEHDLLRLGELLAPAAALLSVRGKVVENGMPRFFRRLAEGVFDTEDVKFRAHELADFLPIAAERHGFDPRRIVAAGYSNGANIAAAMLRLRPEALAGAVLFRPMVPLAPGRLPELRDKPVFVGAARQDPIASPQQAEALARLLQSAGAAVTLRWSKGGHQLASEDVAAAREWLSQSIRGHWAAPGG